MNLKFLSLVLGCTLALGMLACSGKKQIRDFYFPMENMKDGLVYVLEPQGLAAQNSAPEYWLYRSVERDSGLFLTAGYFDENFMLRQAVQEQILPSGAVAKRYVLYEPDTVSNQLQSIEASIEAANTFPFAVRDSLGIFLFKLSYRPLHDDASRIFLIRNRRYLGPAPDFELNGKRYPCIRFGLKEAYGNSGEGDAEVEGEGEEWYAEGLGLVYYQKSIAGGKIKFAYRLKTVLSLDEFRSLAGPNPIPDSVF